MARRFWVGGMVLLALAAAGRAASRRVPTSPRRATHPGLERLKKLAGTWVRPTRTASRPTRSCRSSR